MKTLHFTKRTVRTILTIMIIFPMLACSIPFLRGNNTSPSSSPISLRKVYSQAVAPSTSDQTLSYKDKLNIILPAGLLTSDQTLTISTLTTKLPAPSKLRKLQSVYDVSLGDQHQFDQNLLLEFNYDPNTLDPKKPASEQLSAGFWDNDNQAWVEVPASVDETRHVITISTNHLSIYGFFNWIAGYSASSSDHFTAIYNEKAIMSGQAAYYKANAPHIRTGMPPFISDILEFSETAYTAYKDAGYKLPSGKIEIEVADFDASELRSLVGNIRISTLSSAGASLLRQDCAHELFHAVQRETLGIVNYLSRHWWMEATADYAADHIAWAPGGTGEMGSDITPKYLETTITNADLVGNHAYSTSHFINWLVETKQVMSFKDLWNLTVNGSNNVLKTLNDSIQTPVPFGYLYTEFARFFVFDPASPDKKTIAISKDIANRLSEFPEATKQLRETFPVDYYTAKLWAIESKFERDVRIERMDSNFGMLSYAVLEGDTRDDMVIQEPVSLIAGETANVHLRDGDYLYILMDNTIDSTSQTFDVQVSETNTPAGIFNMRLGFDTSCDAAYAASNGTYNSYSRLNSEIPVEIKGNDVSINYDKTTGVKHFVAQGTGKIDAKGLMTLTYTLNYTLQEDCNGTPCTGTESGFGTFTGSWNPNNNRWEGIGTGSIDVEYPNTMGKSGNNSLTCSASINKTRVVPGFDDPDL